MRRLNVWLYRILLLVVLAVCSVVIFGMSQLECVGMEGVFFVCLLTTVQLMLLALLMQSSMFSGGA